MPEDKGYSTDAVPASAAFPASETQEPKGKTRFGPPPRPERPVQKNVYNVDPHGRKQPGQT